MVEIFFAGNVVSYLHSIVPSIYIFLLSFYELKKTMFVYNNSLHFFNVCVCGSVKKKKEECI